MFDIKTLLILIPALPLAATLLTAALGQRVLRGRSHLPVVAAIALSFVASILLVFQVQEQIERHGRGRTGLADRLRRRRSRSGAGPTFRGDAEPSVRTGSTALALCQRLAATSASTSPCGPIRLTAAMLAIVTCISTLVAIYSIGYMHGDPGYWRFFTYIGLFVFSMTMLVSASNFVLLYVFWEVVGLCSYLLIGFWYEKPAAAAAGKKAFLVNRIGDVGFAPGHLPDLDDLRHAQLPRHGRRSRRGRARADAAGRRDRSSAAGRPRRSACCCCWGRAARAPSSRCTSGCPTRWKAPRRSAP